MVLSGDDLTNMPAARADMLRKLLPPTGVAATFADPDLRVGVVTLPNRTVMAMFNWDDRPALTVARRRAGRVTDIWTSETVGHDGDRIALTLPPRSARLLEVRA